MVGGGDTGMDCVSNALREGAEDVLLLDVYPEVPQDGRYPNTPWPLQPRRLLTTYALDEGGERRFGHQVIGIEGEGDGSSACSAARSPATRRGPWSPSRAASSRSTPTSS